MGFFGKFLAPRDITAPPAAFHVLTFAPAIVRISAAGKEATRELDALAAAVADLGFPQGFSAERVFAVASEMARLMKIDGVAGVTDRMTQELGPEEKSDAMRLALVSVSKSPTGDSGDVAILSAMAEHIGMSKGEFEALREAARAFD